MANTDPILRLLLVLAVPKERENHLTDLLDTAGSMLASRGVVTDHLGTRAERPRSRGRVETCHCAVLEVRRNTETKDVVIATRLEDALRSSIDIAGVKGADIRVYVIGEDAAVAS